MQYTKTIEINVGDVVECLTADGWEVGNVTRVETFKITAFMVDLGREMDFTIDLIKF